MSKVAILGFLLFISTQAQAIYTEVGADYGYSKSNFDASNNIEQQSITGSVSFYFWDHVAAEFSYTNGLYVQKESNTANTLATHVTTTVFSDIYTSSLIYIFSADRKALLQPFIRGGFSYIKKRQVVQDDTNNPSEIYLGPSWAPSYGVGIKIMVTDNLGIKASYDVQQTPQDDGGKAYDITGRAGLSWTF